jgi:hypothetical protein
MMTSLRAYELTRVYEPQRCAAFMRDPSTKKYQPHTVVIGIIAETSSENMYRLQNQVSRNLNTYNINLTCAEKTR